MQVLPQSPGHVCARRAHRSTGWSIEFCIGLQWVPVLAPFDFWSLRYLPNKFNNLFRFLLSPLFLQFSTSLNSNEHLAKSTHTISANLTHDLGLSAPNEIDTWSWRNRYTILTWPIDETYSFKRIASTHTIDFHWSHQIQIEFVVTTCNSHQTPISIESFQLQLSYPNGMHHTCLPITSPEEKQHHMSRLTNVSTTQQIYGTLIQMTWKRTHHESTLTLQLIGSLQSTCLQDGPTKSK